ncbi:MAG: class I SAM-dependent methyltransferase, partial [Crenarchaeota archaeon]|nr:class I SAM-dependent methyltransferase [Thermoproteota archaeon]
MSNSKDFNEITSKCSHNRGRGPSSFWMHDSKTVFDEINLKPGETFLDLGCGNGDYSIYASKIVETSGTIYAIDKNR